MAKATKSLHAALKVGDDDACREALEQGASIAALVDDGDGNRIPALLVACAEGRTAILRLMVNQYKSSCVKANGTKKPNPFDQPIKSIGGSFPIHTAAVAGHRDVVRVLVEEAECNPNRVSPTEYGGTALHGAIRHGENDNKEDVAMLEDLVSLGADINFQDIQGATPLMIACVCGKPSFIRCLLSLGADRDIQDGRGKTCEFYCRPVDKAALEEKAKASAATAPERASAATAAKRSRSRETKAEKTTAKTTAKSAGKNTGKKKARRS